MAVFPSVRSVVLGDDSFTSTTLFPLISQDRNHYVEISDPSVNLFASSRPLSVRSRVGLSSLKLVSFGKNCFQCGPLLEFRSGAVGRKSRVDLLELERISFAEDSFPSVTVLIFQSRRGTHLLSRSS